MHGRLVAGLAAIALLAAAPGQAAVPAATCSSTPAPRPAPAPGLLAAAPAARLDRRVDVHRGAVRRPAFLTAADSAALGGGVNFFAGGPGGALSAATQVVDLSGAAAEIDAGQVTATLSALLGGFATQTDRATVTATFLSAGGRRDRQRDALPAVNTGDRNSVTR